MNELIEAARNQFWWIVAGIAGRLMFHGREAQAGRRKFWGREMPFELLIAVAMGLVGSSLCAWLALDGAVSSGVVSAVAYLGPRAIDTLFDRAMAAAANFVKKD